MAINETTSTIVINQGYALIEYEHFKDAVAAKNGLDGSDLLGNTINVDWAFMKKPLPTSRRSRRH